MNRQTWARLLATTLLSIGVAACGSSGTKKMQDDLGTGDMAMTGDMNVGAGDMAVVAPLYAQITVADVVGTAYVPGASPSASPIPVAGTHVLATTVSFPSAANPASPANPFGGCTINRYDASVGNLPAPDVNSGPVTITGYTYVAGIDAANPLVPSPSPTLNAVNCAWVQAAGAPATVGYYECGFSPSGAPTNDVAFPRLPPTYQPQILLPAGATVVETMDVGSNTTPYVAITTGSIQLSTSDDQFFITSIVGGPSPSPGVSADLAAGLHGRFDGTHDVTINWACDSSGTACDSRIVSGQPLDIAGLLIQTQQGPPQGSSASEQFGVAQCIFPSGAGTLTLTASDIATLLGSGQDQTIRVLFVHIKANTPSFDATGTHLVVPTAGRGEFAFVSQNGSF